MDSLAFIFVFTADEPHIKIEEEQMARILIAEDDQSMRHFLTMALERAGHEVQACEDGSVALRTIEDDTGFDLLLADIVMPGMDGIELSQKACALAPALKVMFITGFAAVALAHKDEAQPQPQTPQTILSKPFHLKELVDQVDRILAA